MKKEASIVLLILVALGIYSFGIASANFNYLNDSISTNYQEGDKIIGSVNLTLGNESINSFFASNVYGSISLIDLLKNNNIVNGAGYNCNPSNCLSSYSVGVPITSFYLNNSKTIGLVVKGTNIRGISSIQFNVQSDMPPSCFKQMDISFLDNNSYDLVNTQRAAESDPCPFSKNYGCFSNAHTLYAEIPASGLCERITLPAAPAYKVGVNIKNTTNGVEGGLRMQLEDLAGNPLGDYCTLPVISQDPQESECIIDYSSPVQKDYLVCVSADAGTAYQINSEQDSPVCGYDGSSNSMDYEIFERPMRFNSVNMTVNDNLFSSIYGDTLSSYAFKYMLKNYVGINNTVNCTGQGCIIPITFAGANQNVVLSNINIVWSTGTSVSDYRIYSLGQSLPTVSSGALNLKIDSANFTIPYGLNVSTFNLLLGNRLVLNKTLNVSVAGFNFDISPKFVSVGLITNFSAILPAIVGLNTSLNNSNSTNMSVGANVTMSSVWDFGDSSNKVVSTDNTAVYTYNLPGIYNVVVQLIVNGTSSTKKFTVAAGNAQQVANLTLAQYLGRLTNLSAQINSYPVWVQREINNEINMSYVNLTLSALAARYNNATNDSDYLGIVNSLALLNLPTALGRTEYADNSPLALSAPNIDLSYIEQISNQASAGINEDNLKSSMYGWLQNNYDAKISFEVVSDIVNGVSRPILTKFKIVLSPKSTSVDNAYLIIGYPINSINFAQNYNFAGLTEGAAAYINVSGANTIEFTVPGRVGVSELGVYLSPDMSKLGTSFSVGDSTKQGFRWDLFLEVLGGAVVLLLIIYFIMRSWYKKNYESHLFKKANDLYNLINFIYNSRVADLEDADIKKKLKEAGWTGEQISYGFNKIDGKGFNLFDKNKVMEELQTRHQERIDTRFINR